MLKIAGALLTVLAVMAIGGMVSLLFSPVRAVRRLLPRHAAA